MKAILAASAAAFVFGQTALPIGVPEWVASVSQVSATGLLFTLFWWLLTKSMPRERADARKHLETVVTRVVNEQREERRQFAIAIAKLTAEIGKCSIREGN